MKKNKKEKNRKFFHYNLFLKDCRGDKILSIYWFVILTLTAGGIFAMVYIFYGTPYDVREIEAGILSERVADCVSYAGRINSDLISNGKFNPKSEKDFLKECHLNFNSEEWQEQQYYTEVRFYKLENLNTPVLIISAGNNNWFSLSNCVLNKNEKRLAQCDNSSFYSLDDLNNQYIIKILAVVRKSEKNVKM
jgi:hypothetical protein